MTLKPSPIPSLDGIRAVSILMVLAAHSGFDYIVPGGLGVTIFFFLSGYLITTLLLAEYQSKGSIHIPHFFARRFFRLAPPLVIVLIFAHAFASLGWVTGVSSVQGFLAQIFYLANYYMLWGGLVPDGTVILWSLAVEEHYYIFYPLVMSLLLRKLRPVGIVWVLLATCAIVLLWRVVLMAAFHAPESRTYLGTDTRIDSIIYGCVLALISGQSLLEGKVSKQTTLVLWLGFASIAATLLVRDTFFRGTLRYSLQGLALMPIFHYVISTTGSPAFRLLNSPVMRRIGVYSYTIYLVHQLIIALLFRHGPEVVRDKYVLLPVAFLLSMGAAFMMDRLVESRFRAIRAKFH